MSALSENLHQSIRRALGIARQHGYDRATPEHLLLALIEDPDAAPVMRACHVDPKKLHRLVSTSLPGANESAKIQYSTIDPRPNASFQSIIQRAVRHVHSVGQDVVTGAHVLVETFTEPAAQLLCKQGMTRYDAVSYVCHGVVKQPAAEAGTIPESGTKLESTTNGSTYEVVLLNDDYTPMEFVVWALREVFRFTHQDAREIMLSVDESGTGSCGLYSRVEAQDLARRVMQLAREREHPLRCVLRPAAQHPHGLTRLVARAVTALVPRDFLPNWFERTAGWSLGTTARSRARRDSNPRPPDSKSGLAVFNRIYSDGLAPHKFRTYKGFASRRVRPGSVAVSNFASPVCPQTWKPDHQTFPRKEPVCAKS